MPSALGTILQKAREDAGLTQREVARRIGPGVESQRVSRWERGKNLPLPVHMAALIEILDLDPDVVWRLWGEAQANRGSSSTSEGLDALGRLGDDAPSERARRSG